MDTIPLDLTRDELRAVCALLPAHTGTMVDPYREAYRRASRKLLAALANDAIAARMARSAEVVPYEPLAPGGTVVELPRRER